jgi:hypothetical protein
MNIQKAQIDWRGELVPLNLSQRLHIALHHMAHPTADAYAVDEWHKKRGWRGIAYNYWIGFDGTIWEGRGLSEGGGVSGRNKYIISIGFQGDYDGVNNTMPATQYGAGVELCRYLTASLDIGEIDGHKHWQSTSCPGRYFPLEQMKEDIRMDIRDFQRRYDLQVDGIAGPITKAKMEAVFSFLRPFVEGMNTDTTYEVLTQGTARYVLVDPLKMGSQIVRSTTKNLIKQYKNFGSGMFNDNNSKWPDAGRLYCLLVVNGKKVFRPQSYDEKAKGTFVIYNDGRVQVATVRDIADVSNIKLAFQGFNLDYDANGYKSRWISEKTRLLQSVLKEGYLDDVVRKCVRVAYGQCGNKVAVICQYAYAHEIRETARAIGCRDSQGNTACIAVDSGSRTSCAFNGEVTGDGGGEIRHIITF